MSTSPPSSSTSTMQTLQTENTLLKTLLSEFKTQLLSDSNSDAAPTAPTHSHSPMSTPRKAVHIPKFVSDGQTKNRLIETLVNETITSVAHPAVLWKELLKERKKTIFYKNTSQTLQTALDKFKTNDGALLESLRFKLFLEEAKSVKLGEEVRSLTLIKRNQAKKLLSEDTLTQDWPVKMKQLNEQLRLANEQRGNTIKLLNEGRKRYVKLEDKFNAMKFELRNLEGIVSNPLNVIHGLTDNDKDNKDGDGDYDDGGEKVNKTEHNNLKSEVLSLKIELTKHRNSTRSSKNVQKLENLGLKTALEKKDVEIKALNAQISDCNVTERQNILNMRSLKATLTSLAVGSLKINEIRNLLPKGSIGTNDGDSHEADGDDEIDVKIAQLILPEEFDLERTRFMSPRPPPSEVKRHLRYASGGGGGSGEKVKNKSKKSGGGGRGGRQAQSLKLEKGGELDVELELARKTIGGVLSEIS